MATRQPTLRDELREYNSQLDRCLRCRYRMTLRLFKIIKGLTQMLGAAAGIYAMHLGADPTTAFALVALIISGPEALEFVISESGNES